MNLKNPSMATLGDKIRNRRKSKNMVLTELADICNISPSFISQIERNRANPSISTLHDIALALGVTVGYFFSDPEDITTNDLKKIKSEKELHVVRADQRKALIYPTSGIRNELLSPDLNREIQMMWVVIPPGADTGDEPLVHEGEECGVVLQGQVEIWAGDEHIILGPGDAVYQKSTVPHRSRNCGDEDVIIVVAITPPSF
jgi:transcriptional regulator with XRE-family HTH domain